MKEIPLSLGKVAFVDDEDETLINQFRWSAQKSKDTFYAVRHVYKPDGKRTHLSMHVFLMSPPPGFWVDHKNHDGLNNTRDNLRVATPAQNSANRKKKPSSSSRFKGVSLLASGKWAAKIRVDGKIQELGSYFTDETEAARAYDCAAKKVFGAFARCNFPEVP